MKSINKWFTPDDFLRLMNGVTNRTIILHQCLCYVDGNMIKIFKNDIYGKIINQPRGRNDHTPSMAITALDIDNNKTFAEVFEQGEQAITERYINHPDVWHKFALWYKTL